MTSKFKPFYLKVLGGLMVLERDPDSNVSKLAKTVLDNLYKKLSNSDRMNSYRYRASHNDVHSTSLPGPSQSCCTTILKINVGVKGAKSFQYLTQKLIVK